ncbi:BRCT domain-containing protein [Aliagarivorans taiwanensis]|uniref:BRCT domain-containing protein n=1 Tax=Aliagarivorans taiwanensis TaxID=561966 RepID=UPI00041D52FA|nr:BRCT domain-containing protein [Aliagarivorans taiwanensis]
MQHVETLVTQIKDANQAYRFGNATISDAEYDSLVAQLASAAPEHPLLQEVDPAVAPEALASKGRITHPVPMLSTDKAYTLEDIGKWVAKVEKAATALGIAACDIQYDVTPKLDGCAARFDGVRLITRGNGVQGYDISHLKDAVNSPLSCVGELVIAKSYFAEHLSAKYENERSFVSGALGRVELTDDVRDALDAGALEFADFGQLVYRAVMSGETLLEVIDGLRAELPAQVDCLTDGLVIDVVTPALREALGGNGKFWHYQLAVKSKGEVAHTTVTDVAWQVGRTGKITPVIQVEPVRLSGATISKCTGHNVQQVLNNGIGKGARIEIIRSGEVIPKFERTLVRAQEPASLERCPSCGELTVSVRGVDYVCDNHQLCPAQLSSRIEHFAKQLEINGVGPKVADALTEVFKVPSHLLMASAVNLSMAGLSAGVAKNLLAEIRRVSGEPVADYRVVAALGIPRFGKGAAKKVLRVHDIADLPYLSAADVAAIDGFGPESARSIANELSVYRKAELELTLSNLFNVVPSKPAEGEAEPSEQPLAGLVLTFTGAMSCSRGEMEAQAEALGAKVAGVSKNSSFLIVGERVGKAKTDKAAKLGVAVLTEAEYRQRFAIDG